MKKLIAIIFALLLVISLSNHNSNNTGMTKEEYNKAVENNTLIKEIRKDLEDMKVVRKDLEDMKEIRKDLEDMKVIK